MLYLMFTSKYLEKSLTKNSEDSYSKLQYYFTVTSSVASQSTIARWWCCVTTNASHKY